MTSWADAIVGLGMAVTRSGGPPAATMALLISLTFSAETRFAEGCTLNTSAFPAETIAIVLLMIVAVGFVLGVIDPMTPNGANSVTIMPRSPVVASNSRSSGPGALSVTTRFL